MKRGVLALALALLSAAAQAAPAKVLASICYHRFGTESSDPYKISLERLGAELDWLKAQGFQSVSLAQVAEGAAHAGQGLPDKGVVLSVDDGYKAGALSAPEFEKRGFHGVYFVNPGTLGKGSFMSWDTCRDLEKQGHEVASHTLTHGNLAKPLKGQSPAQYKAWVDKELRLSRSMLEKELGHPVTALAYPYGSYNPAVGKAAVAAGYKQIYSVSDGVNDGAALDVLRLRRIILMGHPSQASFEKRVSTLPVEAVFSAFEDGALFLRGAKPLALGDLGRDVKMTVDGFQVHELPAGQGLGFHFLVLSQGSHQTKMLFQIAPDAWAPYFDALTEN